MALLCSSRSNKAKIGTSIGELTLLQLLMVAAATTLAAAVPLALPGCPETCGNITVPYPFGTRAGCFREGFGLTCDEAPPGSRRPPKLRLADGGAEVVGISLPDGTVRVRTKMLGFAAPNTTAPVWLNGSWSWPAGMAAGEPRLAVSRRHNRFVAMGCNFIASLADQYDSISEQHINYVGVCATLCAADNSMRTDTSCSGICCCRTPISWGLPSYRVRLDELASQRFGGSFSGLGAVFIADQEWIDSGERQLMQLDYSSEPERTIENKMIPTVMEWWLAPGLDRDMFREPADPFDPTTPTTCKSVNSIAIWIDVDNGVSGRARCNCSKGFEGNPYMVDGCQAAAAAAAPVALPGCPETCGNVTVPYPFGTRPGCFREGFNLTCDEAPGRPPKLLVGDGEVEVAGISLLDGTVRVHTKMLRVAASAPNATTTSVRLTGSWPAGLVPGHGRLVVSPRRNRFVAMGCNLLASLAVADQDASFSPENSYVSVCAVLCADGGGSAVGDTTCSGVGCCQTPIARDLQSYGVQIGDLAARAPVVRLRPPPPGWEPCS
ncbi:hypothetical protein ACP4OV_025753 [Aristida adscensionis]